MGDKIKLMVIAGPTAVGKTSLSVRIAQKLNGEIISADSMQVYRGMDIGTAKITKDEMGGIRHHLIDICDPEEDFSVIKFLELARNAVYDIASRGKIPIIVGGTGFYIQALLYDIDFTEYDDEIASKVRDDVLNRFGSDASDMHEYLKSIDPESARDIHMNNRKKVLHAIEYFEITGKKISDHNKEEREKKSPYDFKYFVITDDREKIYKNIDIRVDKMIESGLVDEVRSLRRRGLTQNNISMLGLSYKEIDDHLNDKITLDEAIRLIKRDTRHFARKQLTWWKREKDIIYVDKRNYEDIDSLISYMCFVFSPNIV
ncbi:MAG: tRNA (adenosine(37)-N6)-dimethylallyltransferase MiaA [Lachnospiraceae bacterium]|nr:tRNA (adenosine(37)-N6)-dimethylallyltransferase MiaA [Lachnospiraceae bacterium]